jgi:LemA protein
MGTAMIAVLVIAALVVLWAIATFNTLVKGRNSVDEAWSGVDTELRRRYDLIPNLVETVKGYASHERGTLEAVVEARNKAMSASGPQEQAAAENLLTGALRQLFALAEAYPDLKANQNFLQLQTELSNTEDRIQQARRFYNASVRDFNNQVQTFPANVVANAFGFLSRQFFELDDESQRDAPQVSFG